MLQIYYYLAYPITWLCFTLAWLRKSSFWCTIGCNVAGVYVAPLIESGMPVVDKEPLSEAIKKRDSIWRDLEHLERIIAPHPWDTSKGEVVKGIYQRNLQRARFLAYDIAPGE